MARTPYSEPEAEKAYQDIANGKVNGSDTVGGRRPADDYQNERERTMTRDSAGSWQWPVNGKR